MDPETARLINDMTAIIWTLSALVVLLALGWLHDDPAVRAKVSSWFIEPKPTTEQCKLHQMPLHECRKQHEDE